MKQLTRRAFLELAGAASLAACTSSRQGDGQQTATLRRIKIATVGTSDMAGAEIFYTKWLGYSVIERGAVADTLAQSWGAPASGGRRYLLMRPASGTDVYIRMVEIDPVPGYKPMTTFGWNAMELIVDDVYKLHASLKDSPFKIIGEPHTLGGQFQSIHAMQMEGPGKEIVYLTCETGDRKASTLPIPHSFVDRPYIMILAGRDINELEDFYIRRFGVSKIPQFKMPILRIAQAQGLADDYQFTLGLLRCGEAGNGIELDDYSDMAGPRARSPGQLPPGVAMASFSVRSLSDVDAKFITKPALLYGKSRAATFVGPAGELTELIEDAG